MVVTNQFGEFIGQVHTGTATKTFIGEFTFVAEYPDAYIFANISEAKRAVKAMKATKRYIASYIARANYGLETETGKQIG